MAIATLPIQRSLLRVAEAAQVLGISRSKTYELIAEGRLPVVRVGASVRVPKERLEAWISANTVDPKPRSETPISANGSSPMG